MVGKVACDRLRGDDPAKKLRRDLFPCDQAALAQFFLRQPASQTSGEQEDLDVISRAPVAVLRHVSGLAPDDRSAI
jgi:hypothetical protein